MRRLMIWAAAGAAIGCGSSAPAGPNDAVEVEVNQAFELSPGQSVAVAGTDLRLRFQGVTQDSRCPEDTECVWSGDASVLLELVAGDGPAETRLLHTHIDPRSTPWAGHVVRLVDLLPHPRSDRTIAPGDYMAVLMVEGREEVAR